MSVAPAMLARLDALPADYVAARFAGVVTFRGVTLDSVSLTDTVAGVYRLTHLPLGVLLQWWPTSTRPVERQVRLVPWGAITHLEPSSVKLTRMLDDYDASRTKPAPHKNPRLGNQKP